MRYKVTLARRVYEYAELTIEAESEAIAVEQARACAATAAVWDGDDVDTEYPTNAINCEEITG